MPSSVAVTSMVADVIAGVLLRRRHVQASGAQRWGVFVHGLGNHCEVANLFANLCKGAVFDFDEAGENYLRPVCQALERRFRSRPHWWMASLKQKYFLNPWLAASLVVATVGLVCTVIHAVYSVLSYVKAGNSWAR
uniref:Uncharacterized protein n=1 Tax=Oryza punctata TaxID=4537 RepID=A0A0E0L0P1_ORYPU